MTYRIRFYEDGRFVSDIGGESNVLVPLVEQLEHIASSIGAKSVEGVIGYRWTRQDGKLCALAIVDNYGDFIKNTNK